MTIMPPLRRPGHVSIAERGVTEGTRAHYAPDSAPSAFSQGRTGSPGPGGRESQEEAGTHFHDCLSPAPRHSYLPVPTSQFPAFSCVCLVAFNCLFTYF